MGIGSGSSAGVTAAVTAARCEELKATLGELDSASKQELMSALLKETSTMSQALKVLSDAQVRPRCFLEINVDAVRHNIRTVIEYAARTLCKSMVVLKANAYGFGALTVARIAIEEGVDAFAVACLEEALELRYAGLVLPIRILVLGAPDPSEFPIYQEFDIDATVDSETCMRQMEKFADTVEDSCKPLNCHVVLDTGMNRLGFETEDDDVRKETVQRILAFATDHRSMLKLVGMFTHMSSCDCQEFTKAQAEKFVQVFQGLENAGFEVPIVHIENSYSTLEDLLDDNYIIHNLINHGKQVSEAYVRCGGAHFYKYGGPVAKSILRATVQFKAQIRYIELTRKGQYVSYCRTWTASEDCLIATLSVGYGDGYPRSLSNGGNGGGHVQIGDAVYPIVGVMCMDMTMINLGPPDGPGSEVKVGEYAVLFDEMGLPEVTRSYLAENSGCGSLEPLCHVSQRVPRIYVNKGVPEK